MYAVFMFFFERFGSIFSEERFQMEDFFDLY